MTLAEIKPGIGQEGEIVRREAYLQLTAVILPTLSDNFEGLDNNPVLLLRNNLFFLPEESKTLSEIVGFDPDAKGVENLLGNHKKATRFVANGFKDTLNKTLRKKLKKEQLTDTESRVLEGLRKYVPKAFEQKIIPNQIAEALRIHFSKTKPEEIISEKQSKTTSDDDEKTSKKPKSKVDDKTSLRFLSMFGNNDPRMRGKIIRFCEIDEETAKQIENMYSLGPIENSLVDKKTGAIIFVH